MSQLDTMVNTGEHNDFILWLRRHKVKQKMIDKLVDAIDSIDELVIIDEEKIDLIAKDLQLNAFEQNKFKYIVQKAKSECDKFHSVIDKEEIEAMTKIENKLKSIQNAIQLVGDSKKKIDEQVNNHTTKIHSIFQSLNESLNKREIILIEQLNKIANEKKHQLEQTVTQLNQQLIHSQQQIKSCNTLLKKPIELNEIEARKKIIITKAEDINNINVIAENDAAVMNNKINVIFDETLMSKTINCFGHIYDSVIPMITSVTDNNDGTISVQWKWICIKAPQHDPDAKIKVEWSELEKKNDDDKQDDVEQKWQYKEFEMKNVVNLCVVVSVGNKTATYLCRMKYYDGMCKSWSSSVSIKSITVVYNAWDLNCIGRNIVICGNIVQCNASAGERSAFLKDTVSNGTHVWIFKIHKCNDKWAEIGIWKTQSGTPPVNTYFTVHNKNCGYAYVIGYGVLTTNGHHGTQYGVKCKGGDVVEMKLNFNSCCLSYKVNNTDYGNAFTVANTSYRAAICVREAGDKIEFIKYEST